MSGMLLNLVIAGMVVGFMIGLTGVGSGALMAPVLLFLGIPPATVVGSDLLFGLLTKIVGVGSHVRRDTISWRWVWLMAIGSVPGVLLGTRILAHFAGAPSTIVRGPSPTPVPAPAGPYATGSVCRLPLPGRSS